MGRRKIEMTAERSSISYVGEVSLSIMHGRRKVRSLSAHNKGTLSLMSFLAKCLGGEYDSANAPRYVRMFFVTDNTSLSASSLTSDTEKTVQPIASNFLPEYGSNSSDEGEASSVTMSFLVPYSLMKNEAQNTECNVLGIYSSDDVEKKDNPLAFVKLNESVKLGDGESLLVSWKMTLKNNDDTAATNG